MHAIVLHNDKLVPLEQVRLSPGQGGLLSGWGLFTTLRVYDGHPFAFERHWKRLETDASRVQLPFHFEGEQVHSRLYDLLEANGVVQGAVRIYFVFNRTGFWSSEEAFPEVDLIMYSGDLPTYAEAASLAIMEHGRYTAAPLIGTKVISWLQNVWSLDQARRRGFDEVILLNERGEVAECTAANIFCVQQGKVSTPPLSSGCLAGVTRAVLLEVSAQAGIEIRERVLQPEELQQAEEVFISSTTRELLPVRRIENHDVPVVARPVSRRLEKAFSQYVAEYIAGCERTRPRQTVGRRGASGS